MLLKTWTGKATAFKNLVLKPFYKNLDSTVLSVKNILPPFPTRPETTSPQPLFHTHDCPTCFAGSHLSSAPNQLCFTCSFFLFCTASIFLLFQTISHNLQLLPLQRTQPALFHMQLLPLLHSLCFLVIWQFRTTCPAPSFFLFCPTSISHNMCDKWCRIIVTFFFSIF